MLVHVFLRNNKLVVMNSNSPIVEEETSDSSLPSAEMYVPREEENPDLERKLTSWEVYNVFLRQLVDQLIDLGASKEIKIVAFQLWASYLRLLGAAFVSKDENKLPVFSSLAFRNKDVQILYGIKNLRKKVFTQKRKRNNSDSSSEKSENVENDAEQEERELNNSNTVDGRRRQTEEQFNNQFKRKKGVVFKSSVSKLLKEISTQTNESRERLLRPKMNPKTRNLIRRVAYDRRFHDESEKSPSSPITIVTLITIIRVALQIVGDEIYLSDILRWMCEGRISFNQRHKIIASYNLNIQYHLKNMKWPSFIMDIRNFTRSLNLKHLPTPNLFHLAKRYCEELNLPNEFLKMVLKLMVVSKVAMDYSKYNFKSFPDYECRVMAFIMFTFKLTCSLDDFTEHQLSKFADLVNDIRSSNDDNALAADIPKLFSWRKWVRFIECRKAVLSMHHVPTNNLSYNDGVPDSNIFFDFWDKLDSFYKVTKRKIDRRILSSLSAECRALSQENVENERESIYYPVSFTPFKTYTEHLIDNHRNLLRPQSRKILSEDFSAESVNMAGNFQWYLNISEKVNIKIRVIDAAKYFDKKDVFIENSSLLALSKTAVPRADIPVAVIIEDDERSEMISNSERIIVSQPEIHKLEFDLERGSRCRSIKVFRSLRYWCFHDCHKKITLEEFEKLATNNFPSSFLWLLRECASMLRASPKELYFELIFVEIMLSRLYPEKFQEKNTLKINKNEW